jgi:hypothetical protein
VRGGLPTREIRAIIRERDVADNANPFRNLCKKLSLDYPNGGLSSVKSDCRVAKTAVHLEA